MWVWCVLFLSLPAGRALAVGPPFDCIDPEARARIEAVKRARADQLAFQPSPVILPPLYMTDAARSYLWLGGIYFQSASVEQGSTTRLLAPLFLSLCRPESRTLLTPLHSYRRDAAGIAGLTLTYFWRRDALADSDVLFPLFWALRERDRPEGPVTRWSAAVPPLLFLGRDDAGEHYTLVPPALFAHWGDAQRDTWVLALAFRRRDRQGWIAGLAPLWFAGGEGERRWDLVPPLLFYRERDGERVHLNVLNTVWQSDPSGWSLSVIPLVFAGARGADHYVVVPPVAHWGDGEQETTVAGTFYHHRRGHAWHAGLVPFYFGGRDGEDFYDLAPPFFLRWGDADSSTVVVGTGYRHRDASGWHGGVAPLYFGGRHGADYYDVVPLLFSRWGDEDSRTTQVGPAYYHRTPEKWNAGVFPLWFSGKNSRRRFDLSPPLLLWHYTDAQETTLHVLNAYYHDDPGGSTLRIHPLWYRGRRGERYHDVVPPALFARWGDGRAKNLWAGPYWHLESGEDWHAGLLPFYVGGRTASSDYDIVPPLLAGRVTTPEGTTAYAVNTWYRSRGEDYDLVSFPFLFRGRSGDEHYTIAPPLLFAHVGRGGEEHTLVGNFYLRTHAKGWNATFFPLYFGGHSGERHYTVVPPLFWRWGDPFSTTTIVGPAWYHSEVDAWNGGLFPLFFGGRRGERYWHLFPPLVWHFGDAESESWFVGPAYHRREKDGWHAGVAPVWFGGRDGERRYDLVPPLLLYRKSDAEGTTLWALQTYYRSRPDGHTLVSFPFVFSGRTGERHHRIVPPLLYFHWGDGQVERTLWGPYWQRSDPEGWEAGLFPLAFAGRRNGAHWGVIPPLLAHWFRDEDTLSWSAATAWYFRDAAGWTGGVAPFYFGRRRGGRYHDFVPPFVWRWGTDEVHNLLAFPWYHRTTSRRWDAGLVPLYFGGREGDAFYDVTPVFARWGNARAEVNLVHAGLPLAIWGHTETRRYAIVPPLLAHWASGPRATSVSLLNAYWIGDEAGWRAGLVPLYFGGRRDDRFYDVVPPVFWRWGDAQTRTTILVPGWFRDTPSGWHAGVLPAYLGGRSETLAYDVVPPLLFGRVSRPCRTRLWAVNTYVSVGDDDWTVASIPFFFAGREGESRWWLVPPALHWHESGPEGSTTLVGNVFYRDRPDGHSFSFFPLVFTGRRGPSHHAVVAPLFWHWGDERDETTIALTGYLRHDDEGWDAGFFPFYFGGREGDDAYDVVPPLFWRFRSAESHRVTLFPLFDYKTSREGMHIYSPLFVHDVGPEHERTVVGGLYWRMRGPDVDARVVFPLWWDFVLREDDSRLTTVFPVYWRWRVPGETTHVFLNVAWSTGHGPRGPKWSFNVVPLFKAASYHPGHLKWVVLEGLAGYEREGDRRRYKIAYVWTDPSGPSPAGQATPVPPSPQ